MRSKVRWTKKSIMTSMIKTSARADRIIVLLTPRDEFTVCAEGTPTAATGAGGIKSV